MYEKSELTNWSRFAPRSTGSAGAPPVTQYFRIKGTEWSNDSGAGNEKLLPGGTAQAYMLTYEFTTGFAGQTPQWMWVDSGVEVDVMDMFGRVCACVGEVIQCTLNRNTGYWETVGTQGLRRLVEVDGATSGQTGVQCTVYPTDISAFTASGPLLYADHTGVASADTIPQGKAWIEYRQGNRLFGTEGYSNQNTLTDGHWIFTDWECPEE